MPLIPRQTAILNAIETDVIQLGTHTGASCMHFPYRKKRRQCVPHVKCAFLEFIGVKVIWEYHLTRVLDKPDIQKIKLKNLSRSLPSKPSALPSAEVKALDSLWVPCTENKVAQPSAATM